MTAEQERIRSEFAAALDTGQGVIDVGRTVICDRCDTDLTDDPRSSGYLFSSYAYGPCCADDALSSIRRHNEEHYIRAYCPEGMSFADWCRSLRGNNNQIIVRALGGWGGTS